MKEAELRKKVRAMLKAEVEGGSFWSDFKDGFMSVVRPAASVAKSVLPLLGPEGKAVSNAIGAVGLGMKKKRGRPSKKGGAVSAGAISAGAISAGALSGGAVSAGLLDSADKFDEYGAGLKRRRKPRNAYAEFVAKKGGKVGRPKKATAKKTGRALPKQLNKWTQHLKSFRAAHPSMSLKEAMKKASATYRKA